MGPCVVVRLWSHSQAPYLRVKLSFTSVTGRTEEVTVAAHRTDGGLAVEQELLRMDFCDTVMAAVNTKRPPKKAASSFAMGMNE